MMNLQFLGPTGLAVSSISLGTYEFGRRVPEREARRIVGSYRDRGGNILDTADRYQDGISEQIVGRIVAEDRDNWVLTTKIYYGLRGAGPNATGLSRKAIRHAIFKSLRRLGTDYIDLLILHRFDPSTPTEETLSVLGELVASGVVLYVGCSNVTGQELRALHAASGGLCPPHSFASVQILYTCIDRGVELEVLPAARDLGLSVQAYSPLSQGLLTGKYFGDKATSGRLSHKLDRIDPQQLAAARRHVEIARSLKCSPIALAVGWLLDRGVQPVIGPTDVGQLDEYFAGVDIALPARTIEQVDAVAPPPRPYPYSSPGSPTQLAASAARSDVSVKRLRVPSMPIRPNAR